MLSASEDRERCLLDEVANGDEKAYAVLFHTYRPKIYSFIFRISGSVQSAEDVTQDVFAKIWQRRADMVSIKNFNAYIFRVAHNHFLNAMKKMAKETLVLQKIEKQSASVQEVCEGLERKELRRLFHFVVDELPQKQKMVFLLSKEKGMKQEEISEQLNISVVTVKSHMTQAFRNIRKKLKAVYYFITIPFVIMLTSFFMC
ncbi:RNA polymerase sigma-70 factor [Terrimonas sp.]|uniref:RNA polymerase sigma factor n=1 Tax=Terrimonas sp. TaxID=1914338 RepID=UPI000D51A7F1|nr:RNA polymerase sigma-70 factor [Terrimonas sp.]PVD49924.1 RNA polymerase sigma-70 factor [Terrimonas sp.]